MRWLAFSVIGLLMVSAAPDKEQVRLDLDTFGRIPVQHDGRYKPLDTIAREDLRMITGKDTFTGKDRDGTPVFEDPAPMAAFVDMLFRPERYYQKPLVWVSHAEVKHDLGLSADRDYFSFKELEAVEEKLHGMIEPLRGKKIIRAKESEIQKTYTRWQLIKGLLTNGRGVLRIVPLPDEDEGMTWFTVPELERLLSHPELDSKSYIVALSRDILNDYRAVEGAYQKGDVAGFNHNMSELSGALRQLGEEMKRRQERNTTLSEEQKAVLLYPRQGDIDYEVEYNKFRPFHWSWLIYLTAFSLFVLTAGLTSSWGRGLPYVILLTGMGFHAYGLLLRFFISGRQPWSSMYEATTLMSFVVVLAALIVTLAMKARLVSMVASLLGVVLLVIAETVTSFSQSIEPLPPALKSMWMTFHTPSIIIGYGAGALLMGVAHAYLFVYLFQPRREALLASLGDFMYRVLQLAVVFLAVGTALGAVWAGEAWGRYWGWDMKEIWALASLMVYVAILHARVAGYLMDFGVAVSALFAAMVIFLTFYGVNMMFGKGLHTYGFGAGTYAPIIGYFVFEILLAGAAFWMYFTRRMESSPS